MMACRAAARVGRIHFSFEKLKAFIDRLGFALETQVEIHVGAVFVASCLCVMY